MSQRVFFVFEGGGAKAISHIGAMRAVEQSNSFHIEGCAGTSAGAIVAALAAAGYNSEEIFKFDREKKSVSSIFDLLPDGYSKPIDLFKPSHWWRLKVLRYLTQRGSLFWTFVGIVSLLILLVPLISWLLPSGFCSNSLPPKICHGMETFFWAIYAAEMILFVGCAFILVVNAIGIASLNKLKDALNHALAKKVVPRDGRAVTFGDFERQGKILKIVASELDGQRLTLFSTGSNDCRDIPVADAVAASSAIPMLFRPVSINGKQYVDGGMVSNLPAWTFDEQLINDDSCWTITSESISVAKRGNIRGGPETLDAPKPLKGIKLFKRISFTALFGASDLNTRGIVHHLRFPIPVNIGLLDFDASPVKIATEIQKSSVICQGLIEARLRELAFLRQIHRKAEKRLATLLGGDTQPLLRTALVREMRLTGSEVAGYHLWACEGFDGCADESLKLTKTGTLIDEAICSPRRFAAADLQTEEGKLRFFEVGRTGYLRTVTPEDRMWSMVFPLVASGQDHSGLGRVSIAVTFDGGTSINGKLEPVRDELSSLVEEWNV